jgi:two-component system secretion response regulator SsrB
MINDLFSIAPARAIKAKCSAASCHPTVTASRVLLIDGHAIVRQGIRSLLQDESIINIVGEVADGSSILEACQVLDPDVVLMELELVTLDGVDAIGRICRRHPRTRIIVLSGIYSEARVAEAFRAGAHGYVLKRSKVETLISAFIAIRQNKEFIDPDVHINEVSVLRNRNIKLENASPKDDAKKLLTKREKQVMKLIAEGQRNRDIAEMLFIGIKTVETHRLNLMKKLKVHNIAEVSMWARRLDIVSV